MNFASSYRDIGIYNILPAGIIITRVSRYETNFVYCFSCCLLFALILLNQNRHHTITNFFFRRDATTLEVSIKVVLQSYLTLDLHDIYLQKKIKSIETDS